MSRIWWNWLQVWCWAALAFGALLLTAAIPSVDGAVRAVFVLFSGDPETAAVFEHSAVRFGLGLQGALTIGWVLTIFPLMEAAKTTGAPTWRALTVAVLVWYVIDSAVSVATGFWLNAISNTVFLVAFMAPIWASGVLTAQGRGSGFVRA